MKSYSAAILLFLISIAVSAQDMQMKMEPAEKPVALLAARIAEAKHDYQKVLDNFFKGIKDEDSLPYDEPPQWFHPVRESMGGFLLRIGNYRDAEGLFRADLERNKHSGRSLFGLMESLKAQKKTQAAAIAQREFESAWKNADTKLSIAEL